MLDYQVAYTFTDGVVFPNTTAVNETVPGAKDGTEFVKIMIDDIWGARQALMNEVGLVPDGVTEKIVTSQQLAALKLLIAQEQTGLSVQEVYVENATASSQAIAATKPPTDNTIPQWSETYNYAALDLSITPTDAANILEMEAVINCGNDLASVIYAFLFRDGAGSALKAEGIGTSQQLLDQIIIKHRVVAGSVAARTYNVNFGGNSGRIVYLNSGNGTRFFGGVELSSFKITERTP